MADLDFMANTPTWRKCAALPPETEGAESEGGIRRLQMPGLGPEGGVGYR